MKILSFFVGLCIWLPSLPTFAQSPARLADMPAYRPVITDRVLVTYSPALPERQILSVMQRVPGLHAQQMNKPLVPGRFLLRLAAGADWEQVVSALQQQPEIILVTPWLKDANGIERGILPELYVKPKSAGDADELEAIVKRYGGVWKGERRDMSDIYEAVFDKSSAYNAWEMVLYLNSLPQVEFADANLAFFPKVCTDDSLFARQWALKNTGGLIQWSGTPGSDIDMENAWTITTGDSTIRIAVLDSGIDTLHPDLKPNLLPGFDATGHGSAGYPNHNFPSDGHGTACAGIIAARGNNQIGIAGVAYGCRMLPVRIFMYIDTTVIFPGIIDTTLHEIPYSETAYMLSGINWAWQTGDAAVLSNSWGIPAAILPFAPINQATISQAISNASTQGRNGKGAVPLFSSGNDNDAVIWPAGSPGTISVGATTNKDKRASFSNYGIGLDVSAPGVQITTTDMVGAHGFAGGDYMLDFGGTSAACPHAAGVAALALSVKPEFTFAQVRSLLRVSAERVGGYNYDSTDVDGSWSQQLGYGRINAHQALLAIPVLSVDEDMESRVSVTLFPNPTVSDITLLTRNFPYGNITYQIIDLSGKVVLSGRFDISQPEQFTSISVAALGAGLYHVRLQGRFRPVHVKFVKK